MSLILVYEVALVPKDKSVQVSQMVLRMYGLIDTEAVMKYCEEHLPSYEVVSIIKGHRRIKENSN